MQRSESGKKRNQGDACSEESSAADYLGAFHSELFRLRQGHGTSSQITRKDEIALQAKLARAFASQAGILRKSDIPFDVLQEDKTLKVGSEHFVEFDPSSERVYKSTLPGTFGLIPGVIELSQVDETSRKSIEAIDGTPLEYLSRWIVNNEVFSDRVRLEAVLEWPSEEVSFVISQPVYHGEAALPSVIEDYFIAAGWQRIRRHSGHQFFFNFAYQVLAMDAESRNCYVTENGLQPFDVILTHPNWEIESLLGLFPDS